MDILTGSIPVVFLNNIWQTLTVAWFLILPPLFYWLFKLLWMDFVQGNYWGKTEWVILEIIPPSDIEETPQAMEMIYDGLSGITKGINAIEEFVNGETRMFLSFELVSKEGEIHFYVRVAKFFKHLVESNIHAQYPTAEVREVPDYVNDVPRVIPNKKWNLWGTDFKLTKPDPYPIKTYKWFEESVTGKALDPLATIIESLGKIGPKQYFWFQLILTPFGGEEYDTGRAIVDKIAQRAKEPQKGILEMIFNDLKDVFLSVFSGIAGNPVEFAASKEKAADAPLEFKLTPGEKEVLKAVEEGIGKNAFRTKMRMIYLGRKEAFNKVVLGSFIGGLNQFTDVNLNSFAPDNDSKTFALHLFVEARTKYRQRKILRRYRSRNRDGKNFFLNTSEVATIYHLPNMSVISPAFKKIETKTGAAPANLPIEQ
ncbi:MAG: hypothetical protein WC682_01125 [Parcubacteria group bacterium]|jgi:hypothetical protein